MYIVNQHVKVCENQTSDYRYFNMPQEKLILYTWLKIQKA